MPLAPRIKQHPDWHAVLVTKDKEKARQIIAKGVWLWKKRADDPDAIPPDSKAFRQLLVVSGCRTIPEYTPPEAVKPHQTPPKKIPTPTQSEPETLTPESVAGLEPKRVARISLPRTPEQRARMSKAPYAESGDLLNKMVEIAGKTVGAMGRAIPTASETPRRWIRGTSAPIGEEIQARIVEVLGLEPNAPIVVRWKNAIAHEKHPSTPQTVLNPETGRWGSIRGGRTPVSTTKSKAGRKPKQNKTPYAGSAAIFEKLVINCGVPFNRIIKALPISGSTMARWRTGATAPNGMAVQKRLFDILGLAPSAPSVQIWLEKLEEELEEIPQAEYLKSATNWVMEGIGEAQQKGTGGHQQPAHKPEPETNGHRHGTFDDIRDENPRARSAPEAAPYDATPPQEPAPMPMTNATTQDAARDLHTRIFQQVDLMQNMLEMMPMGDDEEQKIWRAGYKAAIDQVLKTLDQLKPGGEA